MHLSVVHIIVQYIEKYIAFYVNMGQTSVIIRDLWYNKLCVISSLITELYTKCECV